MATSSSAKINLRDKWDGLRSWLRLGVWLVFIGLAMVLGASLAGFHGGDALATGDAVKNWLGPLGAGISWAALNIMGFAAWVVVALLPVLGWLYWKGAGRLSVMPLMCGTLWALVGLISACGLAGMVVQYKGVGVALGGSAGRVAAESLESLAGSQAAWAVAIVVAVCGLGLMLCAPGP